MTTDMDMFNNNIKYKEAGEFTAYLNTLTRYERARFIKWVAEECEVTRPVVYSWRYMCSRIPEYAKEIIERCAGTPIFGLEKDLPITNCQSPHQYDKT